MSQLTLFKKTGQKLVFKCDCCGTIKNANAKYLDKRLIAELFEMGIWLKCKEGSFNPRWVFNEDHHKIADFQKLQWWGFIEQSQKSGWWLLKEKAIKFLNQEIQECRKIFVLEGKRLREYDSEAMVRVETADPRWQMEKSDFVEQLPIRFAVNE